ncbi:MAG TPA: copper oxidase [Polyangia bacterium]|nr:copper oxidase [Polyangia bacterium]
MSRRALFASGAVAVAGGATLLGAARRSEASEAPRTTAAGAKALPPGKPGRDYTPVIVPNGAKLPWKIVAGVKVFHLVAEEVEHELVPGLTVKCWGYNGHVHGPLIEAVEGDRVRLYVTNRLPEATTVHLHGALVPNGMDGVGGLTQKAIQPGETFKYEVTLRQSGTLMYHSHHDEMTQMALGMTGMFVVHPRRRLAERIDRDFAILLHEWRVDPGAKRPDPNEMVEFNVLTMNAKAFPGTEPLVVRTGERVRIRFGNLSAMDHHPIHLHGYQFNVTATDAGEIPASAQWPEITVLVPTGSTRTIEFVANEPGDWAMHCHMTHHVMNQMGHGLPNLVGIDPRKLDARVQKVLPSYMTMGQSGMGDLAEMSGMPLPPNSVPMVSGRGKHDVITMGGMFTIMKVRDHLASYEDPGWYDAPAGTQAMTASAGDLARDGIEVHETKPPG